jgi:hypothetical protein
MKNEKRCIKDSSSMPEELFRTTLGPLIVLPF